MFWSRPSPSTGEERIAFASQKRLMWWRFKKHRLAVISLVVVVLLYLVAILADFFAYTEPHTSNAFNSNIPPQAIHWFDEDGAFRPYVHGLKRVRDLSSFKIIVIPDASQKYYLTLLARGYVYDMLGLWPTDLHLLGLASGSVADHLFLLGTDRVGRDLFSRLMLASRTSLSVGLVAVALSLVLGITIGGISGMQGGAIDTLIQRVIEVLQSIPTIPLWMGLAAALPRTWSVTQVYIAITVIISLIGWTELARVVRGRFLAMREEEFVVAAELAGASRSRILFRHMLPLFVSHLVAAATLAIPLIIISETTLSFLGLGLRPPAISWGVLLQDAQNIQSIATAPWLLAAVVPVIVAVLAFNFLGDGLRDAADPYN